LETRVTNLEFATSENKAGVIENKDAIDSHLNNHQVSPVKGSSFSEAVKSRHPPHTCSAAASRSSFIPGPPGPQSNTGKSKLIQLAKPDKEVQVAQQTPQQLSNSDQQATKNENPSSESKTITSADEEGFQLPRDQTRRQNRRNRKIIKGTADNTRIKGGSPPNKYFFIYRVEKGTTVLQMSAYLDENHIKFATIELISNPAAKFCSFKLGVPHDAVDQINDPSTWPEGISVRRYFSRTNNGGTK
jgi:hypothetical protein